MKEKPPQILLLHGEAGSPGLRAKGRVTSVAVALPSTRCALTAPRLQAQSPCTQHLGSGFARALPRRKAEVGPSRDGEVR